MRRALPVLLLAIAAGVGAIAWVVLRGEPGTSTQATRLEKAARQGGLLADPARAAAIESAARDAASPAGAEPVDVATNDDVVMPRRTAEPVPLVDVHGWLTLVGSSEAASERGHVVLRSVATSRSPVHVKAAVGLGTFDLRLPGNAVVQVTELVLDGKAVTTDSQIFDLSQSTWLEVRASRFGPTTLRVIDAASGLELDDVRIADEEGKPLASARILAHGGGTGTEHAAFASPVTLAPSFATDAASARSPGHERLRIGAAGHATIPFVVALYMETPIVVALPLAGRLVVELEPWPDTEYAPVMALTLQRITEDDVRAALPFEDPHSEAPEKRGPIPLTDFVVDLDDLAPGRWLVVAEDHEHAVPDVRLRDQSTVDVQAGGTTRVRLDVMRSRREQATLRVRAHDASSGAPIAIAPEQVQVRSTASDWPVHGPGSRRRISNLPHESASGEPLFRTIAGDVEVHLSVVGPQIFRPTTTPVRLARGDNVIDVPLVATAALRFSIIIVPHRAEDGKFEYSSERLLDRTLLRVRDAKGALLEEPATRDFRSLEPLWFLDPGRYEIVLVESEDEVHVLQEVELELHRATTVRLDAEEIARSLREKRN